MEAAASSILSPFYSRLHGAGVPEGSIPAELAAGFTPPRRDRRSAQEQVRSSAPGSLFSEYSLTPWVGRRLNLQRMGQGLTRTPRVPAEAASLMLSAAFLVLLSASKNIEGGGASNPKIKYSYFAPFLAVLHAGFSMVGVCTWQRYLLELLNLLQHLQHEHNFVAAACGSTPTTSFLLREG